MADDETRDALSGDDPRDASDPIDADPANSDPPGDMLEDDLVDPPSGETEFEPELVADESAEVDDPDAEPDPEDVVIDDEAALDEATEKAAVARSTRPVRKHTTAPVKKDRPTAKRDDGKVKAAHQRTTPALFVRQSIGELRKVVWPSGEQLGQYFVVVLVFVLFIMGFVFLLDTGLGWLLVKLLG